MDSFYLLGAKKIFSFLKKALLVIIVYLLVFLAFFNLFNKNKIQIDNKQENKQSYQYINQLLSNKELNNTQEGKIIVSFYKKMSCIFIGEMCTGNPKDDDKNFRFSVFGFLSSLIIFPYTNPPASGIYWIYSNLEKATIIPKTYAYEGIGFAALRPFMDIWIVFRNISYLALVLILISIGFMIMFRTKINPQTVISVENALPKIIISLILITFSFPIAGFLIDLMYVLILIVIQILSPQISTFSKITTSELTSQYLNPSFSKILPFNFNISQPYYLGLAFFNVIPEQIRTIVSLILQFTTGYLGMEIFKKMVGTAKPPASTVAESTDGVAAFGFTLGKLLRLFGYGIDVIIFSLIGIFGLPFLLGLLVLFTVIYLIFRVFFTLFYNYIQTILLIITSPIILLFEALPGKNAFSYWIKNLIANLLSYVIVITLILVSGILNETIGKTDQYPWAPPFIYGLDGKSMGIIIGMGIYLLIPDIIKLVKEMLGIKPLPVSIGLGTFFGGVGAGFSGGMAAYQQLSGLSQIPFIGGLVKRIPIANKIIPPVITDVMEQSAVAQIMAQCKVNAEEAIRIMEDAKKNLANRQNLGKGGGGG